MANAKTYFVAQADTQSCKCLIGAVTLPGHYICRSCFHRCVFCVPRSL